MNDYTLVFPDYFDAEAPIIESKGWFLGVKVIAGSVAYEPEFYDAVRLGQTIEDDLRSDGLFTAENVVVITAVTRAFIEQAVRQLAARGFEPLRPLPL